MSNHSNQPRLSFQRASYMFIFGGLFVALLITAKVVLVPLVAGLLLSFILLPLTAFFERHKIPRPLSIAFTIILVVALFSLVIYLFSNQLIDIVRGLQDFKNNLFDSLNKIIGYLNESLQFIPTLDLENLLSEGRELLTQKSGTIFSFTINTVSGALGTIFLTFIFCILFLAYRDGLREAFSDFAPNRIQKDKYKGVIDQVQHVGQSYILGLILLVLVLSILNSIGLLIIGLDYPFFFGVMVACFAIIPYVGSLMGATIPFAYAWINYDSPLMPLGVLLVFWITQLLESNLLNPKIIGGNLKLNIMAVIVTLLLGNLIWGVPGLILSVPAMAIVKVVSENFQPLQPFARLIGNEYYSSSRYRLNISNWIRKIFGQ